MAVVALLTDVPSRARLNAALKDSDLPVACVTQVGDARDHIAAGNVQVFVVGPRDARDMPTAHLVREVRQDYPSTTVVAYCPGVVGGSDDILALANAGVHGLVLRGVDDDRHRFRRALHGAELKCSGRLVFERVCPHLPPEVAPLVSVYLRDNGAPPSVAQAAELLNVHRKTLVNRLAAAGYPNPRTLRTWCRLFVACQLLDDPGRTVERVAAQLAFETPAGLRNTLKRYTGLGASAVRAAGGLTYVLARFHARYGAHRAHAADAAALDAAPAIPTPKHRRPGRRIAAAASRTLVLVGMLWLNLGAPDDLLGFVA